jgi:hypothetical protein
VSEQPSEAAVAASAPRKAAVAFIFVTILLDMIALGVVIPVLPKLIESFVDNDTASAARLFGLFGTAWALMQFVFSPVLGGLSDRFGRRPVVLLSNFGLAADYVLMALAPSLAWLFVGRLISGITSASVSTAFAYIADTTPPEKRAAYFGRIGVAFGADREAPRRTQGAAARAAVWRTRIFHLRRGADRAGVLRRDSRDGAVGRLELGHASADDARGRTRSAGAAAGRDVERAEHLADAWSVPVHGDICLLHRRQRAVQATRRPIPAGRRIDRAGARDCGEDADWKEVGWARRVGAVPTIYPLSQ